MNKKAIAAVLSAAMLMTACNSTKATESSATETEAATVATTLATTTEITEETTEETEPEKLDMTIDEVVQAILDAAGEEYFIFVDDADAWKTTVKHTEGLVNYMNCGYIGRLEGDDMIDGYNTIYITFEVFEFDTESDNYRNVCETGEFVISRGDAPFMKKHAIVNRQYVLVASGALCNDDEYRYGKDPMETEPPFTIGKTQQGYEAFIALN